MMISLSFATLSVVFGLYLVPLVLLSALALAATDWILSSGDAARSKVEKCWFFVVVNVRKKGVETIESFSEDQSYEVLQSWLLTGFLPLPLGKFSRRFPSA